MDSTVNAVRLPPASSREIRRKFVYQRRRSTRIEHNNFLFLNKKPGTSSAGYNPPDAIQTPESSDAESNIKNNITEKDLTSRESLRSAQKADNSYELEIMNPNNPKVQRSPTPTNPNLKAHKLPIPTNPNTEHNKIQKENQRRRITRKSPDEGKLRTR